MRIEQMEKFILNDEEIDREKLSNYRKELKQAILDYGKKRAWI